jgi:hypothetical protein
MKEKVRIRPGGIRAPLEPVKATGEVYAPNFEVLFADGSWRTTWTHIVPGRFSKSYYTGLLFFEQSTGYAEVYDTDGAGRIVAPPLWTYQDQPSLLPPNPFGGHQWTHVIPGLFGSSGFTGILLYEQSSGCARFLECTGDGRFIARAEYSDWRTTWTQIVPGFFTRSRNSGLLFYSPSENYAEIWETDLNGGRSGKAPVQAFSDWRSTWTHIVAADFFWTMRGFITTAPVFSDLFFYEGSTGYAEMYRSDCDPTANDGRLVPYPTTSACLIPWATNVIAGSFGGSNFSDVLLHDRAAGVLNIYSLPSDGPAELYLRESLSGLRTTIDLIVPGKFYFANLDDHWFNDGPGGARYQFTEEQRNWRAGTGAFTDLLLYDRAAVLGEIYLHEPVPPPAPPLDAYISSVSQHGEALVSSGSILPGETLSFHVSSLTSYTVQIFRQGYFRDARLLDPGQTEQFMAEVGGGLLPPTGPLPIGRTAYRDGAGWYGEGWPVSVSFDVPEYPTGLYLARVHDTGTPQNTVDIPFVVRARRDGLVLNPSARRADENRHLHEDGTSAALIHVPSPFPGHNKILLVIADVTYCAYNDWGGRDVYGYAMLDSKGTARGFAGTYPSSSQGRAPYTFQTSFERPTGNTLGNGSSNQEIPFIQWLMKRRIPVDVCTARDLHFQAPTYPDYRLLIFVGHHEYWTREMRNHVENFVLAGGGVAFLCGNTCWWQVRISPDGKQLTCYKIAGFDPLHITTPQLTTVNWWDKPVQRPETEMTGVSNVTFINEVVGIPDEIPYVVQNETHWAFEGTGLQDGSCFGLFNGTLWHSAVGGECDAQPPPGSSLGQSPPNYAIAIASNTEGAEIATMGSFKKGLGEVFNVASIVWVGALMEDENGAENKAPQITQNVIDRFGPAFQQVSGFAQDIAAGADGTVWVVGTDGSAVRESRMHKQTGVDASHMPGSAVRIAVDPHGDPWIIRSDHSIFRLTDGAWQKVPGSASDIGIGADGSVWIIGTAAGTSERGHVICRWNGSGWDQMPGGGVRIAVGPNGNPWIIAGSGALFEYVDTAWQPRGAVGLDIGVGPDGSAWLVGANKSPEPGGNAIFRWTGQDWRRVRGGGVSISVGHGGSPWIVNDTNEIFYWG